MDIYKIEDVLNQFKYDYEHATTYESMCEARRKATKAIMDMNPIRRMVKVDKIGGRGNVESGSLYFKDANGQVIKQPFELWALKENDDAKG